VISRTDHPKNFIYQGTIISRIIKDVIIVADLLKQHPSTFGTNLKPVAELKISKNFKPRYLDGVILDHPIYHQGKDRIDSMKENENSFNNNQW